MLTIEIRNTIVIFKLKGSIDHSTSIMLENSIRSHLESFYTFIIDLTECEYMNSYTVNLLFQLARANKHVSIVVSEEEDTVKKIFEVLHAEHIVNIYNSCDEALKDLEGKGTSDGASSTS
jgi:anti-anti-sigma factor